MEEHKTEEARLEKDLTIILNNRYTNYFRSNRLHVVKVENDH